MPDHGTRRTHTGPPVAMKIYRFLDTSIVRFILITALFGMTAVSASLPGRADASSSIDTGYSVLRLFLKDEQHLTTIRRVKLVIGFEGVSDRTAKLVDRIADASAEALDELETLAAARPSIEFEEFPDDSIGKATLDSLRVATAKQFLFETDDFEKDLLLSQAQILSVISHLARQLEEKETNPKRKAWLGRLAQRYDDYYHKVYARITITGKRST